MGIMRLRGWKNKTSNEFGKWRLREKAEAAGLSPLANTSLCRDRATHPKKQVYLASCISDALHVE